MVRRIKFLNRNDLALSGIINLADNFIASFSKEEYISDINKIIECFNILRFIKNGIEFNETEKIKKKLNGTIGQYLNLMKSKDLSQEYNRLDFQLYSDFWSFFSKYKLFNSFNNAIFLSFLEIRKPDILFLLEHKSIVDNYDAVIKTYLLSACENVQTILNCIEIKSIGYENKIFLPKSLDYSEIDELFQSYIDSDHARINYLEAIMTIRNRDEIRISDKTRLKAKKKLEYETDIFFQKNEGHKMGVSIKYVPCQNGCFHIENTDGITNLSYDLDWIKNNQDFSTILNNFIYLFGYVDSQMRISLTSIESDIGAIESVFTTRSKFNYNTGWSFQFKEQVSNIQLFSYIDLLNSFNIRIEKVIEWFFSEYLYKYFDIEKFNINIPSEKSTYLEKCRILLPEIDSIIKKYNMFVEDGEVDYDLLAMSSKPLSIKDCKSLFPIKYIYPNYKEYRSICYFLFSDQCMLNYIHKEDKSYSNFYELISSRNVYKKDYDEYLHRDLEWLVKNKLITIDDKGQIKLFDPVQMHIIYDLYKNEVINYINLPKFKREKIDSLLSLEELKSSNSLLSIPEVNFLSYYLNKSEFGNSLDLRNKYVHGTQPNTEGNSDIHKFNYTVILKILILLIIKINDEISEYKPAI